MRRPVLLFIATIALLTSPLAAARSRHQSYVSFDDGNTVIVQADDQRTVDARVNMPVFPGDEVRSSRSGRAEIRLSDENVLAIDRATAVRLDSLAADYDRDASESVVSLQYGEVIVHRTAYSTAPIRLDTEIASYVGGKNSLYAVRSEGRGAEVISVYEGSVEVRTEGGSERVRAGDEAKLDRDGVYGSETLARDGTSDFERWYLRRATRYDRHSGRYVGDRFAYWESDLDSYGSWVYVSDYGTYVWRPRVSLGWRPYYYGSWIHGYGGALVWASDEPWGWLPYHYGRWAYSVGYGWVWLPGEVYSPAWVYWAYGPSYIGWIPAGWFDCYTPYYNWRPYSRVGIDFGGGFYGRVKLRDVDLRGWTFANSGALVSTRVDRAALTVDAIRDRINREGDTVTVGNTPMRFTNEQMRNPADTIRTINRGAVGGGTGKGDSGSLADLTPFIRRDPELPTAVRERVTRGSEGSDNTPARGSVRDTPSPRGEGEGSSVVRRDPATGSTPAPAVVQRPGSTETPRPAIGSRDRNEGRTPSGDRPRVDRRPVVRCESPAPAAPEYWRSRPAVRRGGDAPAAPGTVNRGSGDTSSDEWRRPTVRRDPTPDAPAADETPRRVIDRIGGARVEPAARAPRAEPRDSSPRSGSSGDRAPRASTPRPVERPAPSADKPSSDSSSRSSDSSKGSTRVKRD
jgi:hypothetical protein